MKPFFKKGLTIYRSIPKRFGHGEAPSRPLFRGHVLRAMFALTALFTGSAFRAVTAQAVAEARTIQSPTSVAARKLAEKAVEAMGGEAQWSEVHSVAVTGREITGHDDQVTHIRWLDDWQRDLKMIRFRTVNGRELQIFSQTDGAANEAPRSLLLKSHKSSAFQMARPHFGPLTGLVTQLPAAALLSVLNDPSAKFDYSLARSMHAGSSCINIRTVLKKTAQGEALDMCFSSETFLPTAAFIALPNLLGNGSNISFETVEYKGFRAYGKRSIPSDVVVTRATGHKKEFYLDSLTINPIVDAEKVNGASK